MGSNPTHPSKEENKMYNARIDSLKQEFVIERLGGNFIAFRSMPCQQFPNPGRKILMANEDNQKAWAAIYDLVQFANGA